jgi:hypothetical protein
MFAFHAGFPFSFVSKILSEWKEERQNAVYVVIRRVFNH